MGSTLHFLLEGIRLSYVSWAVFRLLHLGDCSPGHNWQSWAAFSNCWAMTSFVELWRILFIATLFCAAKHRGRPPFDPYFLLFRAALARQRRTKAKRKVVVGTVAVAVASWRDPASVSRQWAAAALPAILTVLMTSPVLAGLLVPVLWSTFHYMKFLLCVRISVKMFFTCKNREILLFLIRKSLPNDFEFIKVALVTVDKL